MKLFIKLMVLGAALTVVACVSKLVRETASLEIHRAPAGYDPVIGTLFPEDKKLDFQKLKTILQTGKYQTIEELLVYLNTNFKDWMAFYTLAYSSNSLHETTPLSPRAILYGPFADFIISFNGDPSHRGYNGLEIMTFDKKTLTYQFQEIAFKKEGKVDLAMSEILFQNNAVAISKSNIPKCTACHGKENTRPIWSHYPLWPGMYGSDDDRVFARPEFEENLSIQRMGRVKKDNDPEGAYWQKFSKEVMPTHPRYKSLPPLINGIGSTNCSPLLPDDQKGSCVKRYGDMKLDPRPNLYLTQLLQDQTDLKLFNFLVANPKLKVYFPALIYAGNCKLTEDLSDIFPPQVVEAHTKKMGPFGTIAKEMFKHLRAETAESTQNEIAIIRGMSTDGDPFERITELYKANISFSELSDVLNQHFYSFLHFAMAPYGLKLEDYTYNLARRRAFNDGYSSRLPEKLRTYLIKKNSEPWHSFLKQKEEILRLTTTSSAKNELDRQTAEFCGNLSTESLKQLSDLKF